MTDELGPVSYNVGERDPFLGREIAAPKAYAESTAARIDDEVAKLLEAARERARAILTQHRDLLDALAEELIAKETVSGARLGEIAAGAGKGAAVVAGAPPSDAIAASTAVPAP